MFKFMILLSLLAFVLGDYDDARTAIYKYMDSNHDGALIQQEIVPIILALNTNKDSVISKEEFIAGMPKLPEIKGYEENLFRFFDRNGDGVLTLADSLNDLDTNHDDALSLDEFLAGATGSS